MSEFLYVSAPELCQGADEDILIEMGKYICEGLVDRMPNANGLRLRVAGDFMDPALLELAANEFQVLLGALRAWRPIAGERRDEVRPGIGAGSVRDEKGNQVVHVGTAIMYRTSDEEIIEYAGNIAAALNRSPFLRNALWLNGRRDRNSADYYMVDEYAETDLGGRANLSKVLDVSMSDIAKLRQSANNLCPTEGGRHTTGSVNPHWGLDSQRDFIAKLLRNWISHLANASPVTKPC